MTSFDAPHSFGRVFNSCLFLDNIYQINEFQQTFYVVQNIDWMWRSINFTEWSKKAKHALYVAYSYSYAAYQQCDIRVTLRLLLTTGY